MKLPPILAIVLITLCGSSFARPPCNVMAAYIAQTRQLFQFAREDEKGGDASWGYDGNGYNDTFAGVLTGGTFHKHLIARKKSGKSNHVLDLFGSGVFIQPKTWTNVEKYVPEFVDSISAVRLKERHFENEPFYLEFPRYKTGEHRDADFLFDNPSPPSKNSLGPFRKQIEGNAFSRKTLNVLEKSMKDREIPKIDVLVYHPIGGVADFFPEKELHAEKISTAAQSGFNIMLTTLNRYYQLLNPNHGEMFLNLIYPSYQSEIGTWVGELKKAGFIVATSGTSIHIIRTPSSPAKLPGLQEK